MNVILLSFAYSDVTNNTRPSGGTSTGTVVVKTLLLVLTSNN